MPACQNNIHSISVVKQPNIFHPLSHHNHAALIRPRPRYDPHPQPLTVMPASPERIASLQSKIWSGSLPLEIRLAASDCRTYTDSDPYLIQYPRLSYLAFLLPRLHAFFAPWLINPDVPAHEAWLSFEEVPLKWHYPAGLLYDLYSGAEPVNIDRRLEKEEASASSHADVEGAGGSGSIPWRLTIHYTDFPDGQLIPLDVEEKTMRDTFTNAMKEADFVRNGTARTAMSLSKQDSNSLWQAVQSRPSHSSTSTHLSGSS